MPKVLHPYAQIPHGLRLDDKGRLLGANLAPKSVTASKMRVATLASIKPDMGEITAGTIKIGTLGQGRTIIGDEVDGFVMRDAAERRWVGFANAMQSARFGYDDGPGAEIVAGYFRVHGDTVVDGTLTAQKLALVGNISYTLIDSDKFFIGAGDPNDLATCTGFYAAMDFVGGLFNGAQTWAVDAYNGCIVTRKASSTDTHEGTIIGTGDIVLSNLVPTVFKLNDSMHALRFRSWELLDAGNDTTEWRSQEIGIAGMSGKLWVVDSSRGATPAALVLAAADGRIGATLSDDGLTITNDSAGTQVYVACRSGGMIADLYVIGLDDVRIAGATTSLLSVHAGGLSIIGGNLVLTEDAEHPWAGPPELAKVDGTPGDPTWYFDRENFEWRCTDGNQRFRLSNTALEAIDEGPATEIPAP